MTTERASGGASTREVRLLTLSSGLRAGPGYLGGARHEARTATIAAPKVRNPAVGQER